MGKGKDKMWEYCEIDENKSIKCKFCKKDIWGVGRMKFHLAKMEGDNIEPCDSVTDDVMNKVLHDISNKSQKSSHANKRATADDFPLPPPKQKKLMVHTRYQLARGAAAEKPNSVRSMDKPTTDGDNTRTEYEAPAIAKALKLENDYFTVVMQSSYRNYLPIPGWFFRKYFPKNLKNVKLSYMGKTWTLGCCTAQSQYRITKGWPACRREMEVNDDSFCVFEMSKAEEIVLKVHVISERKSVGSDDDDDEGGDDDYGDDIHILDELNIDSKTSLAADIANSKMHNDLYEQFVSRYGLLEGNLPRNFHFTAGMKKDILQIVLDMIQTKPVDLSDSVITRWEQIVQAATNISFNVGWLVAILAKMRMKLKTNMNVKLQEEKVENLKRNVHSLKEELRKVQNDFEIACSDLQKLKISEVPVDFDFDCTPFMGRPQ